MATFRETLEALHRQYPGAENNTRRGDAFERLCKWLLETDPRYANRLQTVWLWDDWPGRWGPDFYPDSEYLNATGVRYSSV